jgi:hypothetical protein
MGNQAKRSKDDHLTTQALFGLSVLMSLIAFSLVTCCT